MDFLPDVPKNKMNFCSISFLNFSEIIKLIADMRFRPCQMAEVRTILNPTSLAYRAVKHHN
jgi:hypothetical protein